jgi:hypothetical protein
VKYLQEPYYISLRACRGKARSSNLHDYKNDWNVNSLNAERCEKLSPGRTFRTLFVFQTPLDGFGGKIPASP